MTFEIVIFSYPTFTLAGTIYKRTVGAEDVLMRSPRLSKKSMESSGRYAFICPSIITLLTPIAFLVQVVRNSTNRDIEVTMLRTQNVITTCQFIVNGGN